MGLAAGLVMGWGVQGGEWQAWKQDAFLSHLRSISPSLRLSLVRPAGVSGGTSWIRTCSKSGSWCESEGRLATAPQTTAGTFKTGQLTKALLFEVGDGGAESARFWLLR